MLKKKEQWNEESKYWRLNNRWRYVSLAKSEGVVITNCVAIPSIANTASTDVQNTQWEMQAAAWPNTETHRWEMWKQQKAETCRWWNRGKDCLLAKNQQPTTAAALLISQAAIRGSQRNPIGTEPPRRWAQGRQRAAEFKGNNRATRKLTASYPPASPSTKQQALSSNLKRWIKGSEWKSALFLFLTVTSGQEHLAISPLHHLFLFSHVFALYLNPS